MIDTSESEQDYLKTIYKLCEQNGRATTSQIAEQLQLKPASVTSMVQKLSKKSPPLLKYTKHYGVELTKSGIKEAMAVIRHHRIIETYLHEKLGYNWDEVHDEAERLEHAISPKLIEKMADALGNPDRDPHGHRIPSTNLKLAPASSMPLSQVRSGQKVIIRRIQSEEPKFLRYISDIGLLPNVEIKITGFQPIDQVHHITLSGSKIAISIGKNVSENLFVETI